MGKTNDVHKPSYELYADNAGFELRLLPIVCVMIIPCVTDIDNEGVIEGDTDAPQEMGDDTQEVRISVQN